MEYPNCVVNEDEEKHEECGVVAIYSKKGNAVAPLLYNALIALQHRGQDAAGFTIFRGGQLETRKGLGLVSEVFKPEDLNIAGSFGIGHTRYPTSGLITIAEVQPFINGDIAIAHNGHIANYNLIKEELEGQSTRKNAPKLEGTADSEVISLLLKDRIKSGIEAAVKNVMEKNIEECRQRGFVTTLSSRRRYIPGINSPNDSMRQFAERQAINTPVQGSAADLIKLAMIDIHGELKKRNSGANILISVHDELVLDVPVKEQLEIVDLVRRRMEHSLELSVPVRVSVKAGPNWLDMKEV